MMVLVLPLGLLIGLALGALGGGGSILTVPALVYVLGQDPATATTSSLLVVGASSLIALLPHRLAGRVRVGQGLAFGALGAFGSVVGSTASTRVSPGALLLAFAGLMLVVAVLMLRRSGDRVHQAGERDRSAEPIVRLRPLACACPRLLKLVTTATAVGLLTGFFGVGGGFVLVPALVLALAFPMPVAVGTSLLVIAVNSATALSARVFAGRAHIDWVLVAVFTATTVAGSLVGGRVAQRAHPRQLSAAFAVLLVVVALYTGVRSLPALLGS
ncbi:sulfite exporter TauE/SafE family protein [Terrabacter sp. 2RAF25]|uniref:sulfite exporter TauE/SafE family protein n=1 Tax=Terrabacter sp. 2RAF25 TaxID=3232998 RepID=UPI003F9C44EB